MRLNSLRMDSSIRSMMARRWLETVKRRSMVVASWGVKLRRLRFSIM
jgi:hypothetical protein